MIGVSVLVVYPTVLATARWLADTIRALRGREPSCPSCSARRGRPVFPDSWTWRCRACGSLYAEPVKKRTKELHP